MNNKAARTYPTRLLYWLTVLACAIISAVRVMQHASHLNFSVQPASVGYIYLANQLATHGPYVLYDGEHCAEWPPITPIALMLAHRVFQSDIMAFALVNALCFAAVILFSGLWMETVLTDRFLAAITTAAVSVAAPCSEIAHAALSEILFAACVIGALAAFERYRVQGRMSVLILAGALTAAACMTRYIGITLALALLVPIAVSTVGPWSLRIGRSVLFAMISLTPVALWCLHNKHVTGTYMGPHGGSHHHLHENLHLTVHVLTNWLLNPEIAAAILTIFVISLFAAIRPKRLSILRRLTAPLLFAAAYGVCILYAAGHTDIDTIDDRLLSPIFIPLVWIFAALVGAAITALIRAIEQPPMAATNLTNAVVAAKGKTILAKALIFAYGGVAAAFAITSFGEQDYRDSGYLSAKWQSSQLAARLKTGHLTGTLYSNDPAACYYFGRRPAKWIVVEGKPNETPSLIDDLHDLPTGCTVAWFHIAAEPPRFNVPAAAAKAHLSVLATYADGALLRKLPNPEDD